MKLTVTAPFRIRTGSHTRNLGGNGYRNLVVGEVIEAEDASSTSCNVWITTHDKVRGKIECGTWKNLLDELCVITS